MFFSLSVAWGGLESLEEMLVGLRKCFSGVKVKDRFESVRYFPKRVRLSETTEEIHTQ